MSDLKIGFEMRKIVVPLSDILPLRQVNDPQSNIKRYRTIRASIKEVGLIEPLVVYPQKGSPGKYLLLDGHLRHFALKDLGVTAAECIVARDDECFTYNARVNRLNPIAEHKMIMKAVQQGVKPERIVAALNLKVADVKSSMSLLDGINEAAADLLKDKAISSQAIRLMRRAPSCRKAMLSTPCSKPILVTIQGNGSSGDLRPIHRSKGNCRSQQEGSSSSPKGMQPFRLAKNWQATETTSSRAVGRSVNSAAAATKAGVRISLKPWARRSS